METADLFSTVLLRPPERTPESLLRAAHAYLQQDGTGDLLLRHQLLTHPGTPGDVLAAYLRHPNPDNRTQVLLHPNLPDPQRLAAARRERTQKVLLPVARKSSDPAVLAALATRPASGTFRHEFHAALLANPHTPTGTLRVLLLEADRTLAAGPADGLPEGARSALGHHPDLAAELAGTFVSGPLLLAVADLADLDRAGWAHVEQVLLTDVATAHPAPARPEWSQLYAWERLMDNTRVPGPVRTRAAQALLERAGEGAYWKSLSRRARAQLGDVAADDAALQAQVAGKDADGLRTLLAHPAATTALALAVACSPAADPDVVAEATRRFEDDPNALRQTLAAHPDVATAVAVGWQVGPRLLDLLAPGRLEPVRAGLLGRLAELGGDWSGTQTLRPWVPVLDALTDAEIRDLPWPVLTTLAGRHGGLGRHLTDALGSALAAPGAATLFPQLQVGFTGPAGSLLDALTGVGAAA